MGRQGPPAKSGASGEEPEATAIPLGRNFLPWLPSSIFPLPASIFNLPFRPPMIAYLKNLWEKHFSNPQVIILIGLLALFAAIILWLGNLLAPVLAAVVLAYLMDGIVTKLAQLGARRSFAAIAVFSVFLGGLLTLLFFLVPLVYRQAAALVQQTPMMIAELERFVLSLPERFPEIFSQSQVTEISTRVKEEVARATEELLRSTFNVVPSLIALIVYLIIVPFLTLFFVLDKEKILNWLKSFLPAERELSAYVWQETNRQLANYIRGKFWEILIVGGIAYVAYLLLGLNFAILLAVFTGLSVLVPLLFSRAVSIHPAAIIVAVLFFGGLWGFWGVFFSIPLATLVHAVLQAWPDPDKQRAVAGGGGGGAPPPQPPPPGPTPKPEKGKPPAQAPADID